MLTAMYQSVQFLKNFDVKKVKKGGHILYVHILNVAVFTVAMIKSVPSTRYFSIVNALGVQSTWVIPTYT